MTEERIITTETPDGVTPTAQTTIISREVAPARRGGPGLLIALLVVAVLVVGFYLFSNYSNSEAVKNNAVAGAANEVGSAANKIGNAVENAANQVGDSN